MRGIVEQKPQKSSFYARWSWAILASTIFVVPFAFYNAGMAVQSNVNKIEDWLPSTFRETGELKWFRDNFPTDQFILITWDGCKLAGDPEIYPEDQDDPRIEALAKALRGESLPADHPDAIACKQFIKSVSTGREVLNRLISPEKSVRFEDAVDRLKGSVLGPDGRQTCVLVSLTDAASKNLKAILGRGQYRVFRPSVPPGVIRRQLAEVGVGPDSVHFGGPPVDNIAIDEEGERTLIRLAGISCLLGLGLAWWSLRSIWLTLVVFACGVLSAAFSLAAIWLTGETVDAIVLSMPSLVYVLAISGAVHLINYYKDAIQEGGLEGATERAVIHALKPALLCTATTAIGLLSLYASELTPIRKFGLYSALGVVLMMVIIYLFLPAALYVGKMGKKWVGTRNEDTSNEHNYDAILDTTKMTSLGRFWNGMGTFMIRYNGAVAIGCFLLIIVVGSGLSRARTSIDLLELFDSKTRILQDYRWIEQRLGMLVPLEIVVKFSPDSQANKERSNTTQSDELLRLTFLERLETTQLIQTTIEEIFGKAGEQVVGRSLSAATFAPSMPSSSGSTASYLERDHYNRQFEASREDFIKSGYLRIDSEGNELWRISLRVAAFKGVDYGQFVHRIKGTIEPILAAHDHRVEILRQLANSDPDNRFVGRTVFFWDSLPPKGIDSDATDTEVKFAWRKHQAMVDALQEMLVKSRVKVLRRQADPDQIAVTSIQKLNQIGRVVLVGNFTDPQVALISYEIRDAIDLHGVAASEVKSQGSVLDHSINEPWLSAVYTGVVPIVYKAQRALLTSLVESTLWSFLTITPLMMFVSRSVRAGLVAMLPNILPVVFIFGAMGWMGIAIDIGSMMTASIALGVAVDDTIHYLSWFRDDLKNLRDRNRAILVAYQRCATPTLQAAVISGLGLSVFAFSTFTPTQRFGWLMLTILVAGVVAELVMLPAILAGPLGKVFERSSRRSSVSRWMLIARYQTRRLIDSKPIASRRAA